MAALCRSCDAPVIWCTTDKGKRMPVDRTPVADGNLRLDNTTQPPRARVVGSTIDLLDPTDDGTRYVSHYVTCPDANEWRGR